MNTSSGAGSAAAASSSLATQTGCSHCGDMHEGPYSGCQRLSTRVGVWNPCCKCFYSALPDRLLVNEIFKFLGVVDIAQLSAVCTRWFYLLQDKSLWESVDLSKLQSKNPLSPLSVLPLHAAALQQLRFAVPHLDDAEFPDSHPVDTSMPKLQSLDLGGSSAVDGVTVQALVSATSVLRRLNLGGVVQLSDTDMRSIIPSAKNLRFLSLHDVRLISDATLELVSQHAPGLLSLDVTGCPKLTAAAIVRLLAASKGRLRHLLLRGTRACTGETVHAVSRFAPQLVELDASSDDVLMGSTAISDDDVHKLVHACGGIRTLKLQGQVALSDAKLAKALMLLPRLTELDLTACEGVGDDTVATVARFCPNLRVLRVSETAVSDTGISALACSRRLRILDVARCAAVTLPCVLHTLRKTASLHHLMVGGIDSGPVGEMAESVSAALGHEVRIGHPSALYAGRAAPQDADSRSGCFVEFV